MITTEINIQDVIQMSDQEVDDITLAALRDYEIKMQNIIDEDFNIEDYQIGFELIRKVNIIKKNKMEVKNE